uniref:Endonuclease/exonuclease/phosphatase domain-containing protein n=1 Tax=Trichogramma kaykai TaxID=54128 RepID=A0ABD2WJK5_9HYME
MRAEIGRACDQSRAAAVAPVADHDTCEVRASSIPLSVDVTSSAMAERIVSALGLDRLVPHILSVREWAPRRRSPASAPSAGVAAPDPELRTMVIRFSSANARETFLAATPKFQRLSMHTIFGIADNGDVSCLRANVILPPDRHRLYLTETFLKPTHNTSPLSLPGFNFYHHDRLKRKGGGVGLYVRSDFKVSTIFTSDQRYLNRPEYAMYSIEHCSFKLLLAVVYRHPKAAYPFTFFDTISEILHQYKNVLILGDFNISMIKSRNRHTRYIRNLTKTYNLHLVSNSPTHQVSYIDGSLHISCLDLVFTNDPTSINNFNIFETPFAAGHHFISFKLSVSLPVLLPKTLLLRKLSHIDHTSFNLDLQSELRNNFEGADLSFIGTNHSASNHGSLSDIMHPDLVQATITTSLLSVLDAHAPLQSTVIKPKAKPWFCAELRSLMRTRDRAYRIYSRGSGSLSISSS